MSICLPNITLSFLTICEIIKFKVEEFIFFAPAKGGQSLLGSKKTYVRFGALEEVFMSYRPHGAWRTMEVLEELA
jgi:hypothetical protein